MRASFDYAVIRIVPRVEREEFLNAGVIVLCLEKRYLAAKTLVDDARLKALWPQVDLGAVKLHLEAVEKIAAGDEAAGPLAKMDLKARFHWLTSPRSTILQTGPVRTGVCDGTESLLDGLVQKLVLSE
ncbi:DUF3037 domain-containing protein [Terriglobus tenax]|uniref:DUF3037 domain-containing protein n=1 Tax=Terriglobus tenax TaxID=1111115 RepID=UPI0021DF6D32|nr:DUF3037 domain-containing protein [Terriglobus tenax]